MNQLSKTPERTANVAPRDPDETLCAWGQNALDLECQKQMKQCHFLVF